MRGNYGAAEKAAGHVRNELILDDGKTLIVDCMNPQGGFDFSETTADVAAKHFTVENEVFYLAKQGSLTFRFFRIDRRACDGSCWSPTIFCEIVHGFRRLVSDWRNRERLIAEGG